ncbi:MAG: T9SS type A sorting domain-containing protein [Lewinellaceae bacterium]|nr:T9SS type A sorting domain-containing protein [Lewinellaceae bacterium]
MKKKIIFAIIVIACLVSISSQGQLLLENDKHWIFLTHQENDGGVNILSGFIVNVKGDTIIDDKVYKKLYAYSLKGEHNCQFPPCFSPYFPYEIGSGSLYALLRESVDDGKVYCKNYAGGDCAEEYVLFDFRLNQGDTLNDCVRSKIALNESDGIIDSVATIEIFNSHRKVLFTSGDFTFEGLPVSFQIRIIEGIGFEKYGFFGGTQNELVDVCFGSLSDCNIVSSLQEIAQKSGVKLYPNPASDKLLIDSDIKIESLSIHDITGNTVFVGDAENMNLGSLKPGIYHLSLLLENNTLPRTKLVKL